MSKAEKVMIDRSLYADIIRYFRDGDRSEYRERLILAAIDRDVERRIAHELYTTSKTAKSEAEREAARQEYLDRRGVPQDYRW